MGAVCRNLALLTAAIVRGKLEGASFCAWGQRRLAGVAFWRSGIRLRGRVEFGGLCQTTWGRLGLGGHEAGKCGIEHPAGKH